VKIVSVTLAGPGTEAMIGDAIRSAAWCDWHVLVLTGTDEQNEAIYAAAHEAATKPLAKHRADWADNFGAMRNLALECAAMGRIDFLRGNRFEADWAVWLDTDERLICPDPKLLRETLREFPQVDAVSAPHASGEYHKDRMIRLPQKGSYVGPIHEYWQPDEEKPVLRVGADLLAFDELPRDPDTLQAKMERDKAILSAYVLDHPDEARWRYFLGQTYDNLGQPKVAIGTWLNALDTDDPTALEIRGWSAFRAANGYLQEGDPDHAITVALRGLKVYPASPELLWLLAVAHLHLDKPRHAMHWAHLCLAAGPLGGGPTWERSGFRWLPSHYEAPFEVSALAAEAMGDERTARKAREMADRVKGKREGA
jgi:tetratricopeptide (TPR) repeat protein